jgi:hypothetical protein
MKGFSPHSLVNLLICDLPSMTKRPILVSFNYDTIFIKVWAKIDTCVLIR